MRGCRARGWVGVPEHGGNDADGWGRGKRNGKAEGCRCTCLFVIERARTGDSLYRHGDATRINGVP